MRKLQIGFAFTFMLFSSFCLGQDVPGNQLILPETEQKICFTWIRDSLQGKRNSYVAMLVPVKLKGCPRQFYMQFDTGSPYSLLYRNKLKAILTRYPQVLPLADTAGSIPQFQFTAGNTPILAKEIVVKQFDSTGIDWTKNAQEIIGTIGTDIFNSKVLRINYPGRYISVGNKIADRMDIHWFEFLYTGRGILFPAIIKGKQIKLYFDTGSSAFELLVDKEMAMSMAIPNAAISTSTVESWNNKLRVTSIQTADSIIIASEKLPLRRVAFIEGASNVQATAMRSMGIGGMTGNSLFLDVELVIDTRDGKFGIKPVK